MELKWKCSTKPRQVACFTSPVELYIQFALMEGQWWDDGFTYTLCQRDEEITKAVWEIEKFQNCLVWRHYPFELSSTKYNHNWGLQGSVSRRQAHFCHHISKQINHSWGLPITPKHDPSKESETNCWCGGHQLSPNSEQEEGYLRKNIQLLERAKSSAALAKEDTTADWRGRTVLIRWPRIPLTLSIREGASFPWHIPTMFLSHSPP